MTGHIMRRRLKTVRLQIFLEANQMYQEGELLKFSPFEFKETLVM